MSKFVTIDMLEYFKSKQDAVNETKYLEVTKYLGSDGKIKAENVAVPSSVIPIYVVTSGSRTRYFTDNDGVKTSSEVIGETGKIYIDVEGGSQCIYTYNAASDEFMAKKIDDADATTENLLKEFRIGLIKLDFITR